MSIIRAIKHRLGLSVTPANNFVLDASADNGTMKLARESGQDIMTVDAAGKPRFNQLAQLLSGSGYKVLEGGLILQWGIDKGSGGAATGTTSFPIPFPNNIFTCIVGWESSIGESNPFVSSKTISSFDWNRGTGSAGWIPWIAIGY